LNEASRQVLPRLGVFQGGTMEANLLTITEISEQFWHALRRQLEAAALIEVEPLRGWTSPFLRFHPTLAPMLWTELSANEQARLNAAHCKQYRLLGAYLRQFDIEKPLQARAIASREAPNLIHAVQAAFDAGDPEAAESVDNVNSLLRHIGFVKESEALIARALVESSKIGSKPWVFAQSAHGDQLLAAGRVDEALWVFRAVLEALGDAPTYERAVALGRVGRCFSDGGHPELAASNARDSITIFAQVEQTHQAKRQRCVSLSDLGLSLTQMGQYTEAKKTLNEGLKLAEELNYPRQQGVILGMLGRLAIEEDNLGEAAYLIRTEDMPTAWGTGRGSVCVT